MGSETYLCNEKITFNGRKGIYAGIGRSVSEFD